MKLSGRKHLERRIGRLPNTCSMVASLMKTSTAALIAALLVLTPLAAKAADSSPKALEDDIKSAYIYNFIRFTEWPEEGAGKRRDFNLAIMGNLPLLKTFRGEEFQKASNNLHLNTQACDGLLCAKRNQALFIDHSMKDEAAKLIRAVEDTPVLTISDIPGFADQGGMIELKMQHDRVIFRINLEAVRKSGLYISAQLLQLAEIVGENP